MSWTKTSEGGQTPKYTVFSETLSLGIAVNCTEHNWTSIIDFIPPGTDFTVIANTTAADLSASTGVQLFVGYKKDDTTPVSGVELPRYRLQETPFISDSSQIDAASKVFFRDVSTNGQYPYYWLKCPGGGGKDVTFKIIVGKGSTEVVR
jgi:hypothetical protein